MPNIITIIPTVFSSDKKKAELLHIVLFQLQHAFTLAKKNSALSKSWELYVVLYVNQTSGTEKERRVYQSRCSVPGLSITFLFNEHNQGFTGAVNTGMSYAVSQNADWILTLNDDVYIHPQFFHKFAEYLKRKDITALSCAVGSMNGGVESFGHIYNATGIAFPQTDVSRVDYKNPMFCGTCFFLNANWVESELERMGYILNPLFFAYYEDVELSLRLRKLRKKVVILNQVLLSHWGSVTAQRGSYFQLYHSYRNLTLVILLQWSSQEIREHIGALLLGQIYILGHSFSKGYWKLYPKVIHYIWKNWQELMYLRRLYAQKYTYRLTH